MIWILLIFLLLIVALGVLVYRQDNKTFSRLTGYSLFDILFKSKANYFNKVMNGLEGLEGEHRILIDVTIPMGNEKKYVDAIIIHESGVYVMTGHQKKGWITGVESQAEWFEVLHKGHQVFNNPIIESKRIIYGLEDLLPEINEDVYSSLIVFSDACSLQKIETQSLDVEVLKRSELKKWTKQIGGEVLTSEEINRIYQALEPYMSFKAPTNLTTKPATN